MYILVRFAHTDPWASVSASRCRVQSPRQRMHFCARAHLESTPERVKVFSQRVSKLGTKENEEPSIDTYECIYIYIYVVSICVFLYAFVHNCFMDDDLYFIFYFLFVIVKFSQNYTFFDKKKRKEKNIDNS